MSVRIGIIGGSGLYDMDELTDALVAAEKELKEQEQAK